MISDDTEWFSHPRVAWRRFADVSRLEAFRTMNDRELLHIYLLLYYIVLYSLPFSSLPSLLSALN